MKANIASWMSQHRPDVVLLHIGTNDMRFGVNANVVANNIAAIIDIMRSFVPSVKIVLAQLIPAGDAPAGAIEQLTSLIPGVASQKNSAQSPVVVVNQYSGFSLAVDSDDNIHPNDSGERKMADRWYAELAPLLD